MSNKKVDLRKYIRPVKRDNNRSTSEANPTMQTTDYIAIPSIDELNRKNFHDNMKSATDFALDLSLLEQSEEMTLNGKILSVGYMSRTCARNYFGPKIKVFDCSDYRPLDLGNELSSEYGIAITMELDLSSALENGDIENFNIETRIVGGKEKGYISFGEYPKSDVSEEEQIRLNQLFNNGQLRDGMTATGRYYTIPSYNVFNEYSETKHLPEFEVDGQKYVRQLVSGSNPKHINSQGKECVSPHAHYVWQKVEPITFEITNWDELSNEINPSTGIQGGKKILKLESEQVIMSGIPFNYAKESPYPSREESFWQNSYLRCFLNGAKFDELDGNPNQKDERDWDLTNCGFIDQAFNLDREPVKVYTIPKHEKTIGAYAFAGCVGIEKIIIPEHVEQIERSAFRDLVNTQICIQCSKAMSYTPFAVRDTCKYIYLGENEIIFSPYVDEKLEKTHYHIDMDSRMDPTEFEFQIDKLTHPNYRQNLIKISRMKKDGKVKFIPPDYTLKLFPSSEIEKYYINNNHVRWGKLVRTLGFDKLDDGIVKNNGLRELIKIYYAIGGFSENQGESEAAYDYVLKYVARYDSDPEKYNPIKTAISIHDEFTRIKLTGPYNKDFAKFFMRYYKDDPKFMRFELDDDFLPHNYLCYAHNAFNAIQKRFPNRVVNGNTERDLLSPRFVAEHCKMREYEDVNEGNEELAGIIGEYGYSQEDFEHIQEVYDKAKTMKDSYVIVAEKTDEKARISFRILEKDDPLGFVLGDITNCCQHIGGVGEKCVDEGYLNPNSGFLVFEQSVKDENGNETGETEILGQAWIWYDPQTKTVCFDNIEIPTKILNKLKKGDKNVDGITVEDFMEAVEKSAIAIMKAMNEKGIPVERVTTGEGYNDLRNELAKKYKRENHPIARHQNYSGYSDATSAQYIIKTYDEITNVYAETIRDTLEEAKKDIEDIKEATEQKESEGDGN